MAILAKEFAADTDTETSITTPKQSNAVETSGSEIGGQNLKVLSALDIEGFEIRQAAINSYPGKVSTMTQNF